MSDLWPIPPPALKTPRSVSSRWAHSAQPEFASFGHFSSLQPPHPPPFAPPTRNGLPHARRFPAPALPQAHRRCTGDSPRSRSPLTAAAQATRSVTIAGHLGRPWTWERRWKAPEPSSPLHLRVSSNSGQFTLDSNFDLLALPRDRSLNRSQI